jgi:hypothetical protein
LFAVLGDLLYLLYSDLWGLDAIRLRDARDRNLANVSLDVLLGTLDLCSNLLSPDPYL